MTKCFLENMIKRKSGHIVTISSLSGIYAYPVALAYCSTKFAVTGFMLGLIEFLKLEKLHKDIFATVILPDVMRTRQDVVNVINPKYELKIIIPMILKQLFLRSFTIICPQEVIKTTVDAILKNKYFVTVPCFYSFWISLFNLTPFWVQHIIRYNIRKESTLLIGTTS